MNDLDIFQSGRDEIQRIKAGNPGISHREAFSAAAKNVKIQDNSLTPFFFPLLEFLFAL